MIPIAKPLLEYEEVESAKDVILSGWVTQGPKIKEFEDNFAEYVGSKHACAVSSCTTALHLALLTVGTKPGNIVITASHTFIATANSVRYCNAEPVFVDIDPTTFNMSPECLEEFINENCEVRDNKLYYVDLKNLASGESPLSYIKYDSKESGRIAAILPVHQMGMPCDIRSIVNIARKYNIPVVEDAACAIGSEISFDKGKSWEKIGKPHGDIACFSFHPRKILTTGDGGMITTNNPKYDEYFRNLRQHAMSVSDTTRHNSGKVIFENYLTTAYNYRMTDIQAAVGIEQLKKIPEFLEKRRYLDKLYRKLLGDIKWLRLPYEPDYAVSNWQSYPVRIMNNSPVSRNELMQYLLDNGVSSRPGIMNTHCEAPYSNSKFDLPESEKARDEVILLPLYQQLEESSVEKIAKLVRNYDRHFTLSV